MQALKEQSGCHDVLFRSTLPATPPGPHSPPYYAGAPVDPPAHHNHGDGRNMHSSGHQDDGHSIPLWDLLQDLVESTSTPPGAASVAQPEGGCQAREGVLLAAQAEALAKSCGDALAACDTHLDLSLRPSSVDWCSRRVRPIGEVLELLLQFKAGLDLAAQERGDERIAANVRTTLHEIRSQIDVVHGLTVQLQAVVASGEETTSVDRKRWYREVAMLQALVHGTSVAGFKA